MSTITAIESRSRLPAWSYFVLASVGAALGLWQVGFFDRQATIGKERQTSGVAVPGHGSAELQDVRAALMKSSPSVIAGANDPAAGSAAMDDYPIGDDSYAEVLAETAALQAAMTEEQANDR